MPSLTSLAEEALAQAKKLDEYLVSQGRQHTSFGNDTLFGLPAEFTEAREALVNSAHTLKQLALRPEGVFDEILWAVRIPHHPSILFPYHWPNPPITLSNIRLSAPTKSQQAPSTNSA